MMNDRRREILEATVSYYINTAEPVGSRALADSQRFELSSATVRSELNSLEKEGYLTQVHTSSGRVPTDKGYRFYVDSLMAYPELSLDQQQSIRSFVGVMGRQVQDVVFRVSELMTSLVDYTTIVMTPDIYQDALEAAHLLLVDLDRVLVVLMNAMGMNCEFLLTIEDRFEQEDMNRLSKLLTEKLQGRSVETLTRDDLVALVQVLPEYEALIESLFVEIQRLTRHHDQLRRSLFTSGTANMLKLPEFQNIQLAQTVLASLEETRVLSQLFREFVSRGQDRPEVVIGEDIQIAGLNECSLVLSPLPLTDASSTAIGVLGPKRMAYPKVLSMVKTIKENVSRVITKQEGKNESK